MKSKKGLLIGIGIVIIIAIVATLTIFLNKTSDYGSSVTIELNGSWKVISKAGEYVEDEVIVFQDDMFKDFRDGSAETTVESSFSLQNDKLELKDISKVYYIVEKTENYLIFVDDSDKTQYKVIRNPDNQMSEDWMLGDWDVVMHGDSLTANEQVTFEKDTLKIFKDGMSDPSVSSSYKWENNEKIYVDVLNMNVFLYSINDNTLIMMQEQDGYVWEITKK